jgi:DNA-binding MltR family transcriptional regulator
MKEGEIEKIVKGFQLGHRMTHASIVVTAAAILDQILERAIKTNFPHASGTLLKRLFEDRGPLGTLSAKIDIAYALGITSDHINTELGKIRKIRNEFAHSNKLLSLDTEPIRVFFDQLKRPPEAAGTYAEVFMACITAIVDFLEEHLLRMGITDDLSDKRMSKKENIPR